MRNLRLEPENGQVAGTRDEEYKVEMTGYANWGSPSLWPEKTVPEDEDEKGAEENRHGSHSNFERLPPVDFLKLFRFASLSDAILILVGCLAAAAGGCTFPVMVVLYGDLANTFVAAQISGGSTNDSVAGAALNDLGAAFAGDIGYYAAGTAILGLANLASAYVFVTCLNLAAAAQVHRIRSLFLRAVLRQEIGWHDTHRTGDFAVRMTEDLNKIQEGIGEKVSMFVYFVASFASCITNAFLHGWELTLVILAGMPILVLGVYMVARTQSVYTEREAIAYAKAGAVAEEALGAIRTVAAFGGQRAEVERFRERLVDARKAGVLRGLMTAVGCAAFWFVFYASYGLGFWYGVKLILDEREACGGGDEQCHSAVRYDPSSLIKVFFSVLVGATTAGQAAPYIEIFSMARGAAAVIFATIDARPDIDVDAEGGEEPGRGCGRIEFRDVHFSYPSRRSVEVLRGLSLRIDEGETVALVGPSGSGKSTVIQLLQRFYDADRGSILMGGRDVRDINVGKLRDRIGLVGQEPVLFSGTIGENIRMGRRDGVSTEEMLKSSEMANAAEFISKLPEGFDTPVGERGVQMSGGQKQRVAIARALVRDPDILLLDEATSALDTQSEQIVQSALDAATAAAGSRGKTTVVVVAHRLSTVRNADRIVAMRDGAVVESGAHDDLMKIEGGLYRSLVKAQMSSKTEVDKLDGLNSGGSSNGNSVMSNGHHSKSTTKAADHHLDTWSRRSLRMLRSIANATIDGDSEESGGADDAAWKMESFVGPRIGSVGRASIRRRARAREGDAQSAKVVVGSQRQVGQEGEGDGTDSGGDVGMIRIMKVNSPEWPYVFCGILASVVVGAWIPVYAVLFGEVLGSLSKDGEEARADSALYAVLFFIAGVVMGGAVFLQITMFTVAAERLTLRMRSTAFEAMLRQEIAWFDRPENQTGALCSRLSSDASCIANGMSGSRLGVIFQSTFAIVLGVCVAVAGNWKLGLAGSAFIPAILIASRWQMKIMMSAHQGERAAFEESARLAVEAISNIRTVASLRLEGALAQRFDASLAAPYRAARIRTHLRGLVFGFAQSVPFFAYCGCMYYGGILVENEGLEYKKVFRVSEGLILGTMMVGQAISFAPNYGKALAAATRIFGIVDRKPKTDHSSSSGLRLSKYEGNIEFENGTFAYPSRSEAQVLSDFAIAITAGQKVALVGHSGCGKSTVIQLLQRFYDLDGGTLRMEGEDVMKLNVPQLRSALGIVSQEPVLFDRSLAENIKYGDNDRFVSLDEVVEAGKKANIHDFVTSLPQGYDTQVGAKGTQLSGGQKQRIAIARALIRNPSVLLLDEATSALDTESEGVVQAALDRAQEGRTSITIAHRLSTVRGADKIFVVRQGAVVESGAHAELLARAGGVYARMCEEQTL